MSHPEVTVTVSGLAGVGKTTISLIIEEALNLRGINVNSVDPDGSEYLDKLHCTPSVMTARVNALTRHGLVVHINQVSTRFK